MKAIDKISVGQKFQSWTVLSKNTNKTKYVLCSCECGKELLVNAYNLLKLKTTSCGCKSRGRATTHGLSKTQEYKTWKAIKSRCCQKSNKNYSRYGGRGIGVCDKWLNNFQAFYEDMGPKPSPEHSIDRVDNDKGYFPSNCRWSLQKTQMRNTSRSVIVSTDHGETTIAELAEKSSIDASTIYHRKAAGWPDNKLTKPTYGYRHEKNS